MKIKSCKYNHNKLNKKKVNFKKLNKIPQLNNIQMNHNLIYKNNKVIINLMIKTQVSRYLMKVILMTLFQKMGIVK